MAYSLGKHLDGLVQEYIRALREAVGNVNMSLVLAAADSIVTAKHPCLMAKMENTQYYYESSHVMILCMNSDISYP